MLSIILNNQDVLPDLLAELDKPGVRQVALPRDTFMKYTNAQCFVTGCFTRLDGGGFLLSF